MTKLPEEAMSLIGEAWDNDLPLYVGDHVVSLVPDSDTIFTISTTANTHDSIMSVVEEVLSLFAQLDNDVYDVAERYCD